MPRVWGFRSDLYYRLAHAICELRRCARGDDIRLLVEHFLGVFNREHAKTATLTPRPALPPVAGNIRQLRAVVDRRWSWPHARREAHAATCRSDGQGADGHDGRARAPKKRAASRPRLTDATASRPPPRHPFGIAHDALLGKR